MARKKRIGTLEILGISFVVIVIAVAVLAGLGYILGYLPIKSNSILGAAPTQTIYAPPEKVSCRHYDISSEYENAYGDIFIAKVQASCEGIGGTWYSRDDELGCYFDPKEHDLDCRSDIAASFENYCENLLLADWGCDPSIAYLGCQCERNLPPPWVETCWWQKIDSYTGALDAGSRTEWKNYLVIGKYKWAWELSKPADIEITKENTGVDFYAGTSSGEHTFSVDPAASWGIAVTNSLSYDITGEVSLYQEVCEGDNLNWDPHMFDTAFSQTHFGIQGDA